MRKKELRIVAAFESTTLALGFELDAKTQNVEGRLIPVPREITAGCGLAFSAPLKEKDPILHLMRGREGITLYELVI